MGIRRGWGLPEEALEGSPPSSMACALTSRMLIGQFDSDWLGDPCRAGRPAVDT